MLAHDLVPLRYPQPTPLLAYHLAYVPAVLQRAVRMLCNSEVTAWEVHDRLRVPTKKLVPIRLGFHPGSLKPWASTGGTRFWCWGGTIPTRTWSRCCGPSPPPRSVLHPSSGGPPHDRRYTPRLQALAEELGIAIAPRCRWSAWVSDLERLELLNRCRALVIVSLWEGFGLPALEAKACGAAVIAAAGALPEVVGTVGLLVDPRSVGQIADAMGACLDQGSLLQRAATFSW